MDQDLNSPVNLSLTADYHWVAAVADFLFLEVLSEMYQEIKT